MQYGTRPSLQQANVTRKGPAIHTGARLAHQKNREFIEVFRSLKNYLITVHFSSCHNSLQTLHNSRYSNKHLALNCNDAIKDVPFKQTQIMQVKFPVINK